MGWPAGIREFPRPRAPASPREQDLMRGGAALSRADRSLPLERRNEMGPTLPQLFSLEEGRAGDRRGRGPGIRDVPGAGTGRRAGRGHLAHAEYRRRRSWDHSTGPWQST